MPIPELPEELLHGVFSNLTGLDESRQGSPDTLRAICLANKQCLRIAQPLLYHTLYPGEYYSGPSIKCIAQKLAEFPRLAGFVRYVFTGSFDIACGEEDRPPSEYEEVIPLEDAVASQFERASESIRPSLGNYADRLLAGVREGWEDAHLAFLLVQCRNLECLKMDIPHVFRQSHVHAVLHHFALADKYDQHRSVGQPPAPESGLLKLRQLEVSHWDTENSVKMHDIEGILRKPTLEVWNGHMINLTSNDEYFAFSVQRWALRRISLMQSLMDAEGLERLLECCPKLEHFQIDYGGSTVGDDCYIDFRKFGLAFRKYGHGLRTISIDTRDWFNGTEDYVCHHLGDLTPLTELRSLAVPRVALLGDGEADSDLEDEENFEPQVLTQTLPPSLRALKIQEYTYVTSDNDGELDDKLFDLMASDRFSQLKTIRIERRERFLQKDGLSAIGWNDSKSNDFWVVLKRAANVEDEST